jgi:hypothetical protein
MSLILDALRKLEREKGAPEQRGFVVLGSGSGGGGGRGRSALVAVVAAVVVGALAGAAWSRLGPRPDTPTRGEAVPPEAPPPGLQVVEATPATDPAPAPRPPAGAQAAPSAVEVAPREVSATPPSRASAAPAPRFRLQAITERDGRPVAILNDRLVREGDSFDGVRVIRIGELEVELETGSGRVVVGF